MRNRPLLAGQVWCGKARERHVYNLINEAGLTSPQRGVARRETSNVKCPTCTTRPRPSQTSGRPAANTKSLFLSLSFLLLWETRSSNHCSPLGRSPPAWRLRPARGNGDVFRASRRAGAGGQTLAPTTTTTTGKKGSMGQSRRRVARADVSRKTIRAALPSAGHPPAGHSGSAGSSWAGTQGEGASERESY